MVTNHRIPEPDQSITNPKIGVPNLRTSRTAPRRTILVASVAVVLVALIAGSALIDQFGSSAHPTGQASSSSRISLDPSSKNLASGADYDDGIPRVWQGSAVLRGQAAIDGALASTDSRPFYVGFWAGHQWDRSCPLLEPGANLLFDCGSMVNIGDQPGVVSPGLEAQLRVDVTAIAPGPVIARVHTHDAGAASCPDPSVCQSIMVGDVVWSGAVRATPVTVEQAASVFGASTASYSLPIPICMVSTLPGIPVLPFWSRPVSATAAATFPDAIIAVFPSAKLLAAAAPDVAAAGESNVPPRGSQNCATQGTDPQRGPGTYSLRVHWLARANVLVGVQYDAALGPDTDPTVAQVRADLMKLPAS
jgi:hypothetical protein